MTLEEIERWEDLDERALSCICLHMKDSQLLNVSKAETFAEAWESLETLYEHKNAASLLFLLQQFFTIKMSEGDGVAAHINKVRKLAEQLASIGEKVFGPLDDYDVVGEPSGFIPNVGSDIGDKGAQCFDDGDGNCTVTTRRIGDIKGAVQPRRRHYWR